MSLIKLKISEINFHFDSEITVSSKINTKTVGINKHLYLRYFLLMQTYDPLSFFIDSERIIF